MFQTIHQRLHDFLEARVHSRFYPLFTGVVAIACSVSAIAFVPVLMVAVYLSPQRWHWIALFTSTGSALGGLIVLLLFHHLGWNQVMHAHPEWFSNDAWQLMLSWLNEWGIWALTVIAATPLPQTPALLFLAMTEQSWWSMWAALAAGKLLKYGSVAYLTYQFPERLQRYRQRRFERTNHHITNSDLSP